MRYEVTFKVMVDAPSPTKAKEYGQKFCDTINSKDSRNKAWVSQVVEKKNG